MVSDELVLCTLILISDKRTEIEISFFLLRRLIGAKTIGDKKQAKVGKLEKREVLMINIGSTSCGGQVVNLFSDLAKIALNSPACTEVNEKVALSRKFGKTWRLIGELISYLSRL